MGKRFCRHAPRLPVRLHLKLLKEGRQKTQRLVIQQAALVLAPRKFVFQMPINAISTGRFRSSRASRKCESIAAAPAKALKTISCR